MEIQEYFDKMKSIQSNLIEFIEDTKNTNYFIQLLEDENIKEDSYELWDFLHLLSKISDNYHQTTTLTSKICEILKYLQNGIYTYITNYELFDIFKNNKRVLLFLFKEKMITIDKNILKTMTNRKYFDRNYHLFFYPEIKNLIGEANQFVIEYKIKEEIENEENQSDYEEMRKIGQNNTFISNLIRNDSINEFISYVNQKNLSLFMEINTSIFESNLFLIDKKSVSLIEYAAFFGSIKIFKYLKLNGLHITSSLWLFAIHGKNNEIIHLIEEENISIDDDQLFSQICIESIKCHHNDFTFYIQNNYLEKNEYEKIFDACFKYHNYEAFPTEIVNEKVLFYLCRFNYKKFVEKFMKIENLNVNKLIVFNNNLFFMQFCLYFVQLCFKHKF